MNELTIEIATKTKFDKLPDLPKSDIDLSKFNKNIVMASAALMGVPKKYLQVVNEYHKWQQEQDKKEWLKQFTNNTGQHNEKQRS